MGVLPLEFPKGKTASELSLDGTEVYEIIGVTELNEGRTPKTLKVIASPSAHSAPGKATVEFEAVLRIDTPGEADYYRHGGILQYVLRSLVA
jgi:aconitate hydratase